MNLYMNFSFLVSLKNYVTLTIIHLPAEVSATGHLLRFIFARTIHGKNIQFLVYFPTTSIENHGKFVL